MPWKRINRHFQKYLNNYLLILFVLLFGFSRFIRLNNDTINPDGVNWHYRSQQFINGIKYFQFEKTYQHYHPGVTLMWVTGIPVEVTKIVSGQKTYNNQALSVARAKQVQSYLRTRLEAYGITLKTAAYAYTAPTAENTNPTGQYLNRRVEISVS